MSALPESAAVETDGGRLVDNIVHFARVLRTAGLPVGPAAVVEAVRAVEAAGLAHREDLYWTLHAVFVTRREHHVVFDEAFRAFWRAKGILEKMISILSPVAVPRAPEPPRAAQQRVAEALAARRKVPEHQEKAPVEIDATFTVSGRELLQRKDFAQMSAAEIAAAIGAVRALALRLPRVRTRRLVAASRGRLIDPRRTLRASFRAGGATIPLAFRKRQEVTPPIVALLDISGSMSQYTRVFLHFLHALTETERHVSTFVFGTRLTNVTRQLARKDPDEALAACSGAVADWSGGTRIATALATFNRLWSRRVMHGGPIVLLVTDGLERDTDEDLAHEMDRLHRSCRRLVWLNPLLRFDGFEAKARGIRAILPHVDEFRPVHSLEAVADLCRALAEGRGSAEFDPRRWLKEGAAAYLEKDSLPRGLRPQPPHPGAPTLPLKEGDDPLRLS
jgi:uncharacterized protein with von Willebrand factor type A (vWA) domain